MGIKFISPIMGDILLTGADGNLNDGRLEVEVQVHAPDAQNIVINECTATKSGDTFAATVALDGMRNRIEALDTDNGEKSVITVFWYPKMNRKYRFTIDDVIRCFEDLTVNADKYTSPFENPFLKIFKDAHDRYGSLTHINTFYESVDGSFDLSMMTDKFRDEFIANSDWFSITFHAAREFPDAPYKHSPYSEVMRDYRTCTKEIIRFAGEEVLRDTTTLHFGASNIYGSRALRASGFKAISAYILLDEAGEPYVANHLTREQVEHATLREGWVDVDEDIIMLKLDLVLNDPHLTADKVKPFLDELKKKPHEGEFIQMVIHEQYFYEDYQVYEPDYAERIFTMAEWMVENGYECISLSEIIREQPIV